MSFEQVFKQIDDILRLEVPTALDYTEQTSWILFLRYLDELEQDKADAKKTLRDIPDIRNAFIGFQAHLYEQRVG